MESYEDYQKDLSKILGLTKGDEFNYQTKTKVAAWPEIFVAIGKLQEKAKRNESEITSGTINVPYVGTGTTLRRDNIC